MANPVPEAWEEILPLPKFPFSSLVNQGGQRHLEASSHGSVSLTTLVLGAVGLKSNMDDQYSIVPHCKISLCHTSESFLKSAF
jgi:hypothetical protein